MSVNNPAKWSITKHNPTWRENIPLEDTSLERPVRRMLERLSRELTGVTFKSQDSRYDFWLMGWPIDVQGPHHEQTTQRVHDAFKAGEIIKGGFPAPIYLTPDMILKRPVETYNFLRSLAILLGATAPL